MKIEKRFVVSIILTLLDYAKRTKADKVIIVTRWKKCHA